MTIGKRIMIATTIIATLCIVIVVSTTMLVSSRQMLSRLSSTMTIELDDFDKLINAESRSLAMVQTSIANDQSIMVALSRQDKEELLNKTNNLFDKLKSQFRITHLYFVLPDGTCLLRVHNPSQDKDMIKRATFLEAQKTGNIASGLEMGKNFFSLRVIGPVTLDGKLIGYVECGQEIDHVFTLFKSLTQDDVALALSDEYIKKVNAKLDGKSNNGYTILEASDRWLMSQVISKQEEAEGVTLTQVDGKNFVVASKKISDAFGNTAGLLKIAKNVQAEVDATHASTFSSSSLLVFLFLALLVILNWIFKNDLEKPLTSVIENLERIKSMNFSLNFIGNFNCELYKLRSEIESMAKSLKDSVYAIRHKEEQAVKLSEDTKHALKQSEVSARRITVAYSHIMDVAADLGNVVGVVSSASNQLAVQVIQASQGARQQECRASETALAMERMNSVVLDVARNASQASDTADNARLKAENGARIVGRVVNGIADVQKHALELKSKMTALGEQAKGIGRVINVINDIADQTNLLALNAAIEAARAGEAGRGFAVVADEVRKLAEKTMSATREVGEVISGIQEGTNLNIANVEQTVAIIGDATELATQSGQSLREIVTLVDMTTDQVRSIATASEQQAAASEEVNRSIEDISRISSETSQAMNHSSQAVNELTGQSQVLGGLIEKMQSEGDSLAEFLKR